MYINYILGNDSEQSHSQQSVSVSLAAESWRRRRNVVFRHVQIHAECPRGDPGDLAPEPAGRTDNRADTNRSTF